MTRDDIPKLIAGYATGTLSEAERQALFAAALDDQELFDQLAREQELKELLDQPDVRQRLIASLEPERRAWWDRRWSWMAAAATVAAIALGVYLSQPSEPKRLAVFLPPPQPVSPAPFVPAPPENAPAPPLPAPSAVERSRRTAAPALPPPAAPALDRRAAEPKLADQKPAEQRSVDQVAPAPKEEALKVAPAPVPAPGPAPPPAPKQAPAAIAQTGVAAPQQQAGQSPIASLLDTNSAAGAVGGGGGGGRGGGRAAFGGVAQNKVAAKAVAPAFGFVYSVTAEGGLRIVPSQNGFLSVSAGDQLLASNRALAAASATEIPLPDGATSATIVFSAQQITDSITAIVATPLDASSGTISDPRPNAASRLEVVISIAPRQ